MVKLVMRFMKMDYGLNRATENARIVFLYTYFSIFKKIIIIISASILHSNLQLN